MLQKKPTISLQSLHATLPLHLNTQNPFMKLVKVNQNLIAIILFTNCLCDTKRNRVCCKINLKSVSLLFEFSNVLHKKL